MWSWLFPRQCGSCGAPLLPTESGACLACLLRLPQTLFWRRPQQNDGYYRLAPLNPTVKGVICGFWYVAGSPLRAWVQLAKYKGRPHLLRSAATYLAYLTAEEGNLPLDRIQGILPIPISAARLRRRGYNQTDWIAQGLAAAWQVPILHGYWKRQGATASQLQKTRIQRWESLKEDFRCVQAIPSPVLVVDDVLTTGATLTAALHSLLPEVEVWVVTVGITQRRR